ncbi:MAG TPA: RcpC/CpaB family pilus assembly protein [Actinomycetota bacterium]|nr:RcpC/CpaB family pilus assembly protein [Actinomycetota bacterium]
MITLLAGLLAMLLVFSVLRERDTTWRAAVAGAEIRAGTTVGGTSFRLVDVHVPDAVRDTLVDPASLARLRGWTATRTIQPGELVSRGDLRPPAAPSALRAMSIPVEAAHAVGGSLAAGDHVDVIQVDEDGRARYVVAGAQVLAVNRPDAGVIGAAAGSSSITVAVDARQALRLAAAIRSQRFEIIRSTGADSGAGTGSGSGGSSGGNGQDSAAGSGGQAEEGGP